MALNRNDGSLPTVFAAALILGLTPLLAWGQSADRPIDSWREKLIGKWCDAEHGCTHWWTLFDVWVGNDDSIRIRYRDTPFVIFDGKIQEPAGRWTIKGKKLNEDGKAGEEAFDAVVSELQGLKEVIEGKIKATLRAKIQDIDIIDGIRVRETGGKFIISEAKIDGPEVEIGSPKIGDPKITDVTIDKAKIKEPEMEGSTIKGAKEIKAEKLDAVKMAAKKIEAKRIEATKIEGKRIEGGSRQIEISVPIQISDATIEGGTKAKAKMRDDDEEDGKGKIEVKGNIKGKVTLPAGETSDWKGDFEGTFTALVQAAIKGIYVVIPAACSEAGRPLSHEEKEDLAQRPKATKGEPGRYRSKLELELREIRESEATKGIIEETKKKQFLDQIQKKKEREAVAGKTRAPRPAEPHTQGRFMRKVNGTVSAIEPHTITLELPALPVLDHKCSVRDESPKRVLKLVKQHDAVR